MLMTYGCLGVREASRKNLASFGTAVVELEIGSLESGGFGMKFFRSRFWKVEWIGRGA